MDLVSTSENVENDILLSGGVCDALKEEGFSFYIDERVIVYIRWNSVRLYISIYISVGRMEERNV